MRFAIVIVLLLAVGLLAASLKAAAMAVLSVGFVLVIAVEFVGVRRILRDARSWHRERHDE
jgi:uncharacterized membrane protein YiaA